MTDEGMYHPHPPDHRPPTSSTPARRHQAPAPHASAPQAPTGAPGGVEYDQADDERGRPYPSEPRRWRPDVLPDTTWRLIGAGAAVCLYVLGDRVSWWRPSAELCDRLYPDNPPLLASCHRASVPGSHIAVWLAAAAAALLLIRLTRLGRAWLDAAPAGFAGLADVFALHALLTPPDGVGWHRVWIGQGIGLALYAVVTLAAVQAYRAADVSWTEMVGQLRSHRDDGLPPEPRMPPWMGRRRWRRRDDPYHHSYWRRQRRRRWLFLATCAVAAVVVLRGCAILAGPSPLAPAADPPGAPGAGGAPPVAGAPGGATGAEPASPTAEQLLSAARTTVASARTVRITLDQVAGADLSVHLQITADHRGAGTITTNALRIYDVVRVGPRCWVRNLPGWGVADWVPTCTIPANGSTTPTLDVAALTEWQVMVTRLPTPPGGCVTGPEKLGFLGAPVWRVATGDGAATMPAGQGADPHPVRVTAHRGRLGTLQVDYAGWDDVAAITPP